MKKIKAKLTALVMALCCITAGFAVVTATVDSMGSSNVVAQAEAITYTVNTLTSVASSTSTLIEAYPNDGSGKPAGNWTDKYTLVEGTGAGFCLNGKKLESGSIIQPNDFYIELGVEAKAGDVVTFDGTFYNANTGTSFVFKNCNLLYNGTTWATISVSAMQDIGSLGLHINSSVGGASGVNNQLYLWPVSGTPSIQTWEYLFAPQTADSFKINGEPAALAEMKSTGDGIWFNFSNNTISAGDYVTISGTYYCESQKTVYFIAESHFQWDGSSWSVYTPPIELGKVVAVVDGSAAGGYLQFAEGVTLPVNSWDYAFMLASGNGITVDGVSIDMTNNVKSVGNKLYVTLTPTPASVNSTLSIGGTFVNEELAVKYVIEESKFMWNGSTWTELDYPDSVLGQVFVSDGDSASAYFKPVDNTVSLPISSWDYAFSYVSGNGITVNDVMIDMNNTVKSVGGKFFANLGAPSQVGDILKIGGVFRCDAAKVDYVVEDRQFQWNGSQWVIYGEEIVYDEYKLGKMSLNWPSTKAENAKSGQLYLNQESGAALPIPDASWNTIFTLESGDGIKVNGEVKTLAEIKSTDLGLFLVFADVNVGDAVTISGSFVCDAKNTRYIIEESKFTWNGTTWENYIEYTTIEAGVLTYGNSGNATSIYLNRADGVAFEIATTENNLHWTTAFTFLADSGVGVTLNGTQISMNDIKFPGNMYIGLGTTAKAGDVLVVGGTFYSTTLKYKYVIEESKFIFNGTTWSDLKSSYTISNLEPTASSTAKAPVYLKINGDTDLPIANENYSFDVVDGTFVRDGSALKMTAIYSTTKGFNFKFAKSSSIAAGEVFTLSGSFYCEALDVTYIIEECKLTWTGSAWVKYINYTTYTFNKLDGANGCEANVIYAYPIEGDTLPAGDWDNAFALESGEGLKLNGNVLSGWEMKQPGDFYIKLSAPASKGDELTIDGTFINETTAKKFVFNNCTLVFNGTTWKVKVEIQYTTHNLGALVLHVNSTVGGAAGINNQLYLQRADGGVLPVLSWEAPFYYESGMGFMVNGVSKEPVKIRSTGDGFFWEFSALNAGDIITIGGVFTCDSSAVKYNIQESRFIWTGSGWAGLGTDYSDRIEGVAYDTVTIVNLGLGVEKAVTGLIDGAGLSYVASAENTTGSVKFRFGINAEDMSAGSYHIRLRGSAWDGIHFLLSEGRLKTLYLETAKSVPLNSNTYYVIELGIIDTADGNGMWIYAKVDGALYISDLVAKTDVNVDGDAQGKTFGAYTTSHLSFYGDMGAVTLYDPDRTTITYTTAYGTKVEYAPRNVEYTLPQGKTYDTFIGWLATDGTIYKAGATVVLNESLSLTAITLDFALDKGAAIRLSNDANTSGIRFTTFIKAADLAALEQYGITIKSYGTLIMPFDYLSREQAPNLVDFEEGSRVLKLVSTYNEVVGDYIVYRGAMQKLNTGNYARLFAGRGYMELTINGEDVIVYTPFDMEDNVRSIRSVAHKFQADTAEYEKIGAAKKAVVEAYAANGTIELMNYAAYGNNNFLHLIAWYYPELDPSNAYNNETNDAIAKKIKAAGMTAVYLDGAHHLDLNTQVNIEKTRQIINFFWTHGLYTIAFGSNASTNLYLDHANAFPDFSDCEGFMGYLVWDEPQSSSFDELANFANKFESIYAGTDVMFMANLLPSYASIFNGTSNWWDSSVESLNEEAYKTYVKQYCETVLSQIEGEKWLSMDSYPINEDGSLLANFLFDLAVLKYYAETYDAHAHAALQSSGWTEGSNSSKDRMPTEAEMRMQAYAAMAFGVDSISWWSYSDKREDNQKNPTDNDEYYERFANVNKELSAISAVYSAFDWKGVILGAGENNGTAFNKDEDYEAYNLVRGQIGGYELSVSDTKLLSKVETNKGNWNYLMGVMEDMNGNEGYVICNYNSHEEDRAQTLTLTFDENVTEVIIYRNGVAGAPVKVDNKTLTIALATGEGVIVLPSKIG